MKTTIAYACYIKSEHQLKHDRQLSVSRDTILAVKEVAIVEALWFQRL